MTLQGYKVTLLQGLHRLPGCESIFPSNLTHGLEIEALVHVGEDAKFHRVGNNSKRFLAKHCGELSDCCIFRKQNDSFGRRSRDKWIPDVPGNLRRRRKLYGVDQIFAPFRQQIIAFAVVGTEHRPKLPHVDKYGSHLPKQYIHSKTPRQHKSATPPSNH